MRVSEAILSLPLVCCLFTTMLVLLLATNNLVVEASNCHVTRFGNRGDSETEAKAIVERPHGCVKVAAGGAKLGDPGVADLVR